MTPTILPPPPWCLQTCGSVLSSVAIAAKAATLQEAARRQSVIVKSMHFPCEFYRELNALGRSQSCVAKQAQKHVLIASSPATTMGAMLLLLQPTQSMEAWLKK